MQLLMLFRGKPVYIDGTQEDADKFTDYYKRMEEQLIGYQKESLTFK